MSDEVVFYICPKCFKICEQPDEEHKHNLIQCRPLKLTEAQRKPLYDENGKLLTRAPRWFLEEIGVLKSLND